LYQDCPTCQRRLWSDYRNYRTVATLLGLMRLVLRSRRCHNADCPRYLRPYRPEAAGRHALPQHAFGLDVIALVGARRSAEHRSVPAIHHLRTARGLAIAQRTVTNLLDRDDELLAVTRTDADRLRGLLADQGRVLLASDGLQPDVGHEVLWGLRDCLAGTVLLARSLLSSRPQELAARSGHVRDGLPVPSTGVLSDGQHSSRKAVAQALPGVPHQLGHLHYLRAAARPLSEADRHAKKELQQRVRGVRPRERQVEQRTDPEAAAVRGYCDAVRSAVTEDGRPPLEASGLKLHERWSVVVASLDRVAEHRGSRANTSG